MGNTKLTAHKTQKPALNGALLGEVACDVDGVLSSYFKDQLSRADQHFSHHRLWENYQTVIMAGGKRLRPYLVVLGYLAGGGTYNEAIIDVATAWELLHQAMLIHDDIIDRDYIRRGVSNVSGLYRRQYKVPSDHTIDVGHYADSAALLAGDLGISGAYQLMINSDFPAEKKLLITQTFGRAIERVVMGELQDTEAALEPIGTANARLIAELKTASYSFVGPLVSGAQLAGVNEVTIAQFEKFGDALGIAFQLRDDWLGLFGDSLATGKSIDSDVQEGKQTLLVEYAYERATSVQKKILEHIVGKLDATPEEVDEVREIVTASGGKAAVEALIDQYTHAAQTTLHAMAIDSDAKTMLDALSERLLQRQN